MMNQASDFLISGEGIVENDVVFDLVSKSNCTSYDCEFVALASALDVPLVTEDKALLRSFPGRCLSLAQVLAGS